MGWFGNKVIRPKEKELNIGADTATRFRITKLNDKYYPEYYRGWWEKYEVLSRLDLGADGDLLEYIHVNFNTANSAEEYIRNNKVEVVKEFTI